MQQRRRQQSRLPPQHSSSPAQAPLLHLIDPIVPDSVHVSYQKLSAGVLCSTAASSAIAAAQEVPLQSVVKAAYQRSINGLIGWATR